MQRRHRLFALAALCFLADPSAALAQLPADSISILSVEPSGPLPADRAAKFTVLVEVTVASVREAAVAIGFNSENALRHEMGESQRVVAGTHRVRLSAETTPRDWGRLAGFHLLVILEPAAPGAGVFTPLADQTHQIPVVQKPRSAAVHADTFASLEAPEKLAVLREIASAASDLQATEIVAVMHRALRDVDPSVRRTAAEAIHGRTQASDVAATAPHKPTPVEGRRAPPPAEWAVDGDVFRAQLQPELSKLARHDEDQQVRLASIDAINEMVRLQGPHGFDGAVVTLFAEVYRQDSSAPVRARVVQMLGLSTSEHAEVSAVLRAAFVDPDPTIRTIAAGALMKIHPGLDARLRFVDVRDELTRALSDPDPAFRAAALTAVELVHQDARELLTVLQRMAERDPDPAIRQQARGVLELMK